MSMMSPRRGLATVCWFAIQASSCAELLEEKNMSPPLGLSVDFCIPQHWLRLVKILIPRKMCLAEPVLNGIGLNAECLRSFGERAVRIVKQVAFTN
jgi:hypothetical protein